MQDLLKHYPNVQNIPKPVALLLRNVPVPEHFEFQVRVLHQGIHHCKAFSELTGLTGSLG
jgi:hypothetical protein